MSAIPGPPERPDVPEFWHLSEIVLGHDATASESEVPGLQDVIARYIPEEVLMYMASQRSLRPLEMVMDEGTVGIFSILMAQWVDAFCAGAAYQKKYGDVPDGR